MQAGGMSLPSRVPHLLLANRGTSSVPINERSTNQAGGTFASATGRPGGGGPHGFPLPPMYVLGVR